MKAGLKGLALVAVFAVGVAVGATAVVARIHSHALAGYYGEQAGSVDLGGDTDCSPQEIDSLALAVLSKYYCPIDAHAAVDSSGGSVTAHSQGGRSIAIRYASDVPGRTEVRVQVSGPKVDMCHDFARMLLTEILYIPRPSIARAGR